MLEGFWILRFQTAELNGGGVVVFINGKVFGGDNGFAWLGSYAGDQRQVKARVLVHNFDSNVPSIFGIPGNYEMHFSGSVEGEQITGTAMIAGQPQFSVGIQLTKRANL